MNDIKDSFGICHDNIVSGGQADIIDFARQNAEFLQFCTPGHKGSLCALDLTELGGGEIFPRDSVSLAENEVARHYGVKKVRFSLGGSSHAIKASVLAVNGPVIAPEFSHKSLFEAGELAKVDIITFKTGETEGLPTLPLPQDYEKAIEQNPTVKLAFVTSPDYFGRVADVKGIKEVCEKFGVLLLCDAAHGAHFASSKIFPLGGEKVADFVALSAHKTLSTLTQGAIGACNIERYFDAYDRAFTLLGTSSPSYILLGSIYKGVINERQNSDKYQALKKAIDGVKKSVKCLRNDDEMRLVVDCKPYKTSGKKLFDELVKRNIIAETYYGDYCIFIITLGDSVEKIDSLKKALEEVLKG